MNILSEIEQARAEIQSIRRAIHAHPELRYEEHRTAELVAHTLTEWGIEVHRGLGKTGVVGTLRAGASARAIGLRADMDALPIQEQNAFAHRSQNAGKMHACGHDGHTAMLLGAARYLARRRDFDGAVHLIFQPAEEDGAGARAMVEDGLFRRFPVNAVFGLHNRPGLPAGTFGVASGPVMAASCEFEILVKGVGAHAAMPHMGRDPVFAAVQIANGLQSMITRNKKPLDTAVLSITQFHAGDALNVIPETARLGGTVRAFAPEALDLIETRMRSIAQATASAYDCEIAEFSFRRESPAVINNAAEAELAADVMTGIVGAQNVNRAIEPTMGAEDFSYLLREKPGCYAFIGNGDGDHRGDGHGAGPCMLHNPSYDFNDDILTLGATYWVRLAEAFLPVSMTPAL
ncbi:putative hippurate hydrolase protein HipO (Benzoylglycine amidohydrolase) (Hippuricase) [Candidatus Glomeribacter gigasporarum BEG34]|uniref:Putative hippurate hydrolase protein HipO (Benzoylglycine amidohydrolase) (Hippuricase) n=1 Tax=Candidatus Glomeribacter gigasporarum BEG34 TaxID=1070319 RepID=G2J9Q4_9BURK|nr:M20 aminoacylase family protein [Candidatus Glomeribacter gigasporarum]CCD29501.1 putative hippurate hydrolase protein HipO (Benzoylglycine amidohydrolase) (Hippuricase) [Candidatus Glomeribacter gigasporarum BEG34]